MDAVTAAHHKSYLDRRPHVPKKFTELLEEYKYNPSIRGDAQLKLLFSYISEMQIGPYLWIRHWLEYEYLIFESIHRVSKALRCNNSSL